MKKLFSINGPKCSTLGKMQCSSLSLFSQLSNYSGGVQGKYNNRHILLVLWLNNRGEVNTAYLQVFRYQMGFPVYYIYWYENNACNISFTMCLSCYFCRYSRLKPPKHLNWKKCSQLGISSWLKRWTHGLNDNIFSELSL